MEYDITGVLCENQISQSWLMTDFFGTLSSVSFTNKLSLALEKFNLKISPCFDPVRIKEYSPYLHRTGVVMFTFTRYQNMIVWL